jgi:hypothetical protein
MRRFAVAVFAGLTLAACVKTRVAAQDFTTGTFTICGNNKAGMEDLHAKARETCPAGPRPLRCAEQVYGSTGSAYANAYGSSGYGVSSSHALVGNCCEYACPAPETPGAR